MDFNGKGIYMKTKFCNIRWVVLWAFSLVFSNAAWAWNAGGHMMVAYIAEQRLNEHAKRQVDRLLQVSMPRSGASEDFVNAAHWADDVRELHEFDYSRNMHFIDMAFSPDGTPLPAGLPYDVNIVNALKYYLAILKSQTSDKKRAEALRFIVHFVGDIHQPLHCVSRVTRDKPLGDKGGNEFQIYVEDEAGHRKLTKLHSYWDGGLGSFPKYGENFRPPSLTEIPLAAEMAVAENPDSMPDWKGVLDFQAWAKESHELALSVTYQGIFERSLASPVYIDRGIQTVNRQIAWAGYRLAALLNEVWP